MDVSTLFKLPDELLEEIVFHLPPTATLSFGSTCRRANKIASEHLIWRRHCLKGWRYWDSRHNVDELRQLPPAQVRWRQIFADRHHIDKEAIETFEAVITSQQHRVERIARISHAGYDVKDLLQRLRDHTPDEAEDVLARRYFAGTILSQIHRRTALEKWSRLQKQQMVRLEEVLGAYDLFVLRSARGDLQDIDEELQRLADAIRAQDSEWEGRSTRERAIQIAQYLRDARLVGNPSEHQYHALRNNFIGMALFTEPHSSLPLQSVAIYCAVARRLEVLARPSNYPHHVHAVIEAPPDYTLDGKPRKPDPSTDGFDTETMHMDPWRSSEEVPRQQLILRLQQMGAPQNHYGTYLSAASTVDLIFRTGNNIMTSVQEGRLGRRNRSSVGVDPDIDAAWYSMLWSMMILDDGGPSNGPATSHRRRQCLPFLINQLQAHFPEDVGLVEQLVVPLLRTQRENVAMANVIATLRAEDCSAKTPVFRNTEANMAVRFRIGQLFQHRRYGYQGFIIGWNPRCAAEERWINQMRVDELPRGREQPFYNIIADDKSMRYVAEENVEAINSKPHESLMHLAGRYFKRWDGEKGMFVSNIRDEYPDD